MTTAKSIAESHRFGCMPLDQSALLYKLRYEEVMELASRNMITTADLQTLERGGRFLVAAYHFDKCDEDAKQALRHDEHHTVRSAAAVNILGKSRN